MHGANVCTRICMDAAADLGASARPAAILLALLLFLTPTLTIRPDRTLLNTAKAAAAARGTLPFLKGEREGEDSIPLGAWQHLPAFLEVTASLWWQDLVLLAPSKKCKW